MSLSTSKLQTFVQLLSVLRESSERMTFSYIFIMSLILQEMAKLLQALITHYNPDSLDHREANYNVSRWPTSEQEYMLNGLLGVF